MVDVDLEVRARIGDDGWVTLADGCASGDSVEGVMAHVVSDLRGLADAIEARVQVSVTPSVMSARLNDLESRLGVAERG